MNTPRGVSYQHTQRGTLILVLLPAIAIGTAITARSASFYPLLVVVPLLLIITFLFGWLTVKITPHELHWHFGPGLIRKTVLLADIASVRPVRTNVLEGWGIHLSRYGWLYNVSGFDAVAVTLHNGKCFALGTDEPEQLAAALAERLTSESMSRFRA
jgi:hypothetical protein